MNDGYRAVAGRIRQELPALAKVAKRATEAFADFQRSGDDRFLDASALNLHGYYSGMERIFELIARRVDGAMPEGPNWHAELLAQMASGLSDLRPPVIAGDLHAHLERLRGFRHVVRNVYTYNLDAAQVAALISEQARVSDQLALALGEFADQLDAAART